MIDPGVRSWSRTIVVLHLAHSLRHCQLHHRLLHQVSCPGSAVVPTWRPTSSSPFVVVHLHHQSQSLPKHAFDHQHHPMSPRRRGRRSPGGIRSPARGLVGPAHHHQSHQGTITTRRARSRSRSRNRSPRGRIGQEVPRHHQGQLHLLSQKLPRGSRTSDLFTF